MLVWLNGAIVSEERARVSPFDRGFLFGEGVYEVVRFFEGVPVAMPHHEERLAGSLAAIGADPTLATRLGEIFGALLDANRLGDAMAYLQITRGGVPGRRAHRHEAGACDPTIFGFVSPAPPLADCVEPEAIAAATHPDERWRRCDIKSTNLLGNVLAMEASRDDGVAETILHRDGLVAEGASSSVFAVVRGELATPPLGGDRPILEGTMRRMAIDLWRECGGVVEERPLPLESLADAEEILITSSRRLVSAVASLDGRRVGGGGVGPLARSLQERFVAAIRRGLPAAASPCPEPVP